MSNTHGPENMRFCSEPISPGPGLRKACPANGFAPSAATARPSGPIRDLSTKYGPSPVMRKPMTWSSWDLVNDVIGVFPIERDARLNVARPETRENGEPDCQVNMLLRLHPLSSGLKRREGKRRTLPLGRSLNPLAFMAWGGSDGARA